MKLAIMTSAAAIAVYAGATANTPRTPPLEVHAPAVEMTLPTPRSELRAELREPWTNHVVWTRSYIVAAVDGGADAPAHLTRITTNQGALGSAVGGIYGRAAAEKLSRLLKQHIVQAADLVNAFKGGEKEAIVAAESALRENTATIERLLMKLSIDGRL